jgi:sugar phosphate isomerase/epimerase
MKKEQIAAQLYTVRDLCQTADGLRDTCRKLRDIGYTAVQVSGIGPIPCEEVAAITADAGLKICVTHLGFDEVLNNPKEVARRHRLYGTTDLGVGCMPREYWDSYEGQMTFARKMVEGAKVLADYGLHLAYHNHNFEFTRFPEGVPMEGMTELFMQNGVNLILDLYWIQAGGASPVDWIRKVAGHMNVVHFKDMTTRLEPDKHFPAMAEIGEGNMNWRDIIRACDETGVRWAAVEQDTCYRDPIESLAISYRHLMALTE